MRQGLFEYHGGTRGGPGTRNIDFVLYFRLNWLNLIHRISVYVSCEAFLDEVSRWEPN